MPCQIICSSCLVQSKYQRFSKYLRSNGKGLLGSRLWRGARRRCRSPGNPKICSAGSGWSRTDPSAVGMFAIQLAGWSRSSSTYLPICLDIVWSYPLNSPFWSHTWLHDLNSWPNHRCVSFLFFLFLCCLKASSIRCRHRQDWQLSFDATSLEATCINAFVRIILDLSCRPFSKSVHKDYNWFDIVFV